MSIFGMKNATALSVSEKVSVCVFSFKKIYIDGVFVTLFTFYCIIHSRNKKCTCYWNKNIDPYFYGP